MQIVDTYVNGRFVTQPLTGVQRHAIEIVKAMDLLLHEKQYHPLNVTLLMPPGMRWVHSDLQRIALKPVGRRLGHAWEQLELPRHAKGLLLNLCNTYPVFARQPVVTIHDASTFAAPRGYTAAFRLFYRLLYAVLRWRRGITVLTDSRFSAGELERYLSLNPQRIEVVSCGCDHWQQVVPAANGLDRFKLQAGSYVLAVASDNPNKNIARLKRAFAHVTAAGFKLVLVGGSNSRVFSAEASVEPEWLVRTGRVDDSELAALYQGAACFVFPSLYEGFGLPPLEAMRFGCPVVAAHAASLPEVCANAAHYCDPLDEADIARAISEVLANQPLRDRLTAAGRLQVERFRWETAARNILDLMEKHAA